MLFKEIIAVYCGNHTKNINTKYSFIYVRIAESPLGFKGLVSAALAPFPFDTGSADSFHPDPLRS
jgi:hypothetical protein